MVDHPGGGVAELVQQRLMGDKKGVALGVKGGGSVCVKILLDAATPFIS